MQKADDGDWVLYEDYARLKAEVERLTARQTDIDRVQAQSDFYQSKLIDKTAYTQNIQLLDQVKNLEAQVYRLTKAGDEMACHLVCSLPNDVCGDLINRWNAAKEGKQP